MSAKSKTTLMMLRDLLPREERKQVVVMLTVALLTAAVEVLGVASILPFMAALMDPEVMDRSKAINAVMRKLGLESVSEQLVALGFLSLLAVVISNFVAAGAVWVQQRFATRTTVRLSTALFDAYLRRPYAFHVRRDASSLIKVLQQDTPRVVAMITSIAQVAARTLVIAALLLLLLSQNPDVAIAAVMVLGGAYSLVYRMVKQRQTELGIAMNAAQVVRQRSLHEGLGGIRDLLVLQREAEPSRRYEESVRRITEASATNTMVSLLPRHLLETITFGGILAISLILLLSKDQDVATIVPTLALYAFVGYRLLPALQQLFASAVTLRFSVPALHTLHADWQLTNAGAKRAFSEPAERPLHASLGDLLIELRGVGFQHEDAQSNSLSNISVKIHAGETIGLVGRSGSGKSTLADLILGLHVPSEGAILIDGAPLDAESLSLWRSRVGYVPQHVFLSNASIAQNVAFGMRAEDVDPERVTRALKLAQAEEFLTELPAGLDTIVGERGVRLSGGQRQRLGIARALYTDPEVLIFDEATSALDGLTEESVMTAVHALRGSRTIILIAHRLRTIEACDRVLLLEAGMIVADGPYNQLLAESAAFQKLAGRMGSTESAPA